MIRQRYELVGHRARIGLVGEHKIEDRSRLQRGQVSRSIRHQTVGHFQKGLQHRSVMGIDVDQHVLRQGHRVQRLLEPAADIEKPPTLRALMLSSTRPANAARSMIMRLASMRISLRLTARRPASN